MRDPRTPTVLPLCSPVRDALLTAIAAAFLMLVPRPVQAEDDWWGPDKGLHFGASLVIAAGGHGAAALILEQPWQRAVVGGSLGLTVGIAKEVHDLAGYGDPSWKDLVWDVAGVATGVGIALLVEALIADDGAQPATATPATLAVRF